MWYQKKDKNGKDVMIQIYHEDLYGTEFVKCVITKKVTKNYILFKKEYDKVVFTNMYQLCDINDWDCARFKAWIEITLNDYNSHLEYLEKNANIKILIGGGCD